MSAVISVSNGVTRHPAWRMAEPVNLEICEGEQIAICGDNAQGKSRLVEILTEHYPLLGAEGVRFNFETKIRRVDEVTGVKRLVSEMVRYITFRDSYGEQDGQYYYQQRWNQHDIAPDTPTVGDLLGAVVSQREGLREELYELFGMEALLDKYIISLSSGELRKFQLVRTLLGNPRVLIMDNPFIGLDAGMRDMLRELLAKLARETELLVILILSRSDEVPEFVTHVYEVKDLVVGPKMTRAEFLAKAKDLRVDGDLQERLSWIRNLPEKDLSLFPFYPQHGGEIMNFHDVSVRYGSRRILNGLNWVVREGERWAVCGENGAGKSTLLSLVCADNPQSYACRIDLFGHRRGSGESIWDIKRHIGYVSPEMHRAYLKDLPAIDIVASGLSDSVGLYARPKPGQREVCMGWMRVFGIADLADRTFLRLSSGEQRLCLLARAFVKDPELLVLDEPLHGLDLRRREMVRRIIQTFCERRHKTLVMVTHYVEELPEGMTHSLKLKVER